MSSISLKEISEELTSPSPPGGASILNEPKYVFSKSQQIVWDHIMANENVLILSSAGAGKTFLLHRLKEYYKENLSIMAFTGVAARSAGGTTIHSFISYLGLTDEKLPHIIAIDEASMCASDLMERLNISMNMKWLHLHISNLLNYMIILERDRLKENGKIFEKDNNNEHPEKYITYIPYMVKWGENINSICKKISKTLISEKHQDLLYKFVRYDTRVLSEKVKELINFKKMRKKYSANVVKVFIDFLTNNTPERNRNKRKQFNGIYKNKANILFGNCQYIFAGDMLQIAPIKKPYVFESKLWKHMFPDKNDLKVNHLGKVCFLNEIIRQTDEKFIKLLNKIRVGDIDDWALDRIIKIVKKRIPNDKDISRFFVRNIDVNNHNELILNKYFKHYITIKTQMVNPEKVHFRVIQKYMRKSIMYKDIKMAVGVKVMLSKNLNIKGGLVNGTIGHITKIDMVCGYPDTIWVQFIGKEFIKGPTPICRVPKEIRKVRYKKCQYIHMEGPRTGSKCGILDCMDPEHYTLIEFEKKSSKNISTIIEEKKFTVSQYPLRIAYAFTVCKSQSLTLDRCIFDHTKFNYIPPSNMYVAISRCTTEEGFYILSNGINPSYIRPNSIAVKYLKTVE